MRLHSRPSPLPSTLCSSQQKFLLYVATPLVFLFLLFLGLSPQVSHSSWTGRFALSSLPSYSSSSSLAVAETPSNKSLTHNSVFDGSPEETPHENSTSTGPSLGSASKILNETTSPACNSSSLDAVHQLMQNGIDHGGDAEVTKHKRYSNLEKLEASLARIRSSIREAALVRNLTSTHQDPDYIPQGPIYRNPNAFHRSYLEMEKHFKIYVYKEGELPMFHNGPGKSIYSSEGRFIYEMEKGNMFRTNDPDEALVYFLPFSVVMMVQYLYEPNTFNTDAIGRTVVDYVNVIAGKYPFWNRSLGADHFMLSCHDWGPRTSSYVPNLFNKSIRVLCNANTSEGFNPAKDASLPEINLVSGETTGLIGGPSPSKRPILAFFAGHLHGHIRYLLLNQWKDKDQDVQVFEEVPKEVSYYSKLRSSRFCLCPSGYEVASPRIVEAIYAECVPVLISDAYVAPFSDVLNWKAFSVEIPVSEIGRIKEILSAIPQRQYLRMQRRVKQIQRHFVVNGSPKRFDFFHMILHSIWLRRLNVGIQQFGAS